MNLRRRVAVPEVHTATFQMLRTLVLMDGRDSVSAIDRLECDVSTSHGRTEHRERSLARQGSNKARCPKCAHKGPEATIG